MQRNDTRNKILKISGLPTTTLLLTHSETASSVIAEIDILICNAINR